MNKETDFSFGKSVALSFPEAVDRIKSVLGEQGFGILSEIDVAAKFKEKLGIDYRPYLILGACNPKLAHQALGIEIDLGVLLPCNVIVYVDEAGQTILVAMDPAKAMRVVGNPALDEVAKEVRRRLGLAFQAVD